MTKPPPSEHIQSLPTRKEIDLMAKVLVRRHGTKAVEVANFFALEHSSIGDMDRCLVWKNVAKVLISADPSAYQRVATTVN